METKVCNKCNKEQPIEMFRLFKSRGKMYRRWDCRECVAKYSKKRYENFTEEDIKRDRDNHRKWREKNRERDNATHKKWKILNKEAFELSRKKTLEKFNKEWRIGIRRSCINLIRRGNVRPDICSMCWRWWHIHAHHPDYNKPLEVIFICSKCHWAVHSWQLEIDKDKIINLEKYRKRKSKVELKYTPIE